MIRQLRSIDSIVRGAEARLAKNGSIVLVGEEKSAEKDEEAEDGASDAAGKLEERFLPKVESPVYNLAYGQMLMVSRSYTSAISKTRGLRAVVAFADLSLTCSLPSSRLRARAAAASNQPHTRDRLHPPRNVSSD